MIDFLKQFLNSNAPKRIILSIFFSILLISILSCESVYGQPPIPPPPEVSWNPPNEGKAGGQSHYDMAGWSSTQILIAWTADIQGNQKSTFDMDEGVYLYVDTPINWMENRIWLYEYNSLNASSGRWIFWMRMVGFGRFRFGPFYPDKSQIPGNLTWKVWIMNIETGEYQDYTLSTHIIPEFTNPHFILIISISLSFLIFLKKMPQIGRTH